MKPQDKTYSAVIELATAHPIENVVKMVRASSSMVLFPNILLSFA